MRAFLDLPWGQVHLRTIGDAKGPLLLMLHQSPLSSREYQAVLPLLTEAGRPVALDTPGFGLSDPPHADWEVADYAEAIWKVADLFSAGEPINLFGRATGAVLAYAMVQARPAAAHRLILHGLPVYTRAERAERLSSFAPPYELASDGSHLTWIWNRIKNEYPWADPALATSLVRDYLAAGPDFATAYRAIWRYDLESLRLPEVIPTLLIGGSRDRIAYMHARAVRFIPAATAVWLEGCTDFVAEQQPERFARILVSFLSASR